MPVRIRSLFLSAVLIACGSPFVWAAGASQPAAPGGELPAWEAGIQYNFVHTNAPPGGCGCFSMNGGAGWLARDLSEHWAVAGEIASQHASNISGSGEDLTLTSYMVGPRYQIRAGYRIQPFIQALFGAAHASGSFAPGTDGNAGSPNAFSMASGGGLNILLSKHLALRVPQVDYYLTHFDNAVNNHQNNLRVSAGVSIRLGQRE